MKRMLAWSPKFAITVHENENIHHAVIYFEREEVGSGYFYSSKNNKWIALNRANLLMEKSFYERHPLDFPSWIEFILLSNDINLEYLKVFL